MREGWLVDQLPRAMASDDFLRRFVGIFERITDRTLDTADGLENHFDPAVAPVPMVRYMARWLGTQLPLDIPEERQRMLLKAVGPNLEWRGTKRGLETLVSIFTDSEVVVEDTGGIYASGQVPDVGGPGAVTVRVGDTGLLSEQELLAMIDDEIPAGVDVEVIVDSQRIEAEAPESLRQEMLDEPAGPEEE